MARRGYPREFRRRVVDLVEGGRSACRSCRRVSVASPTLYSKARPRYSSHRRSYDGTHRMGALPVRRAKRASSRPAIAMGQLAADAELRHSFGAAGRARVEQRFGLERIVEQLEQHHHEGLTRQFARRTSRSTSPNPPRRRR